LLIPEFARLSAIESVALVPRLDISFAKESLLRRGAGGGGGGAGDLNDWEKLLEIVRLAHQRFLRLRILAQAGDRRYADQSWRDRASFLKTWSAFCDLTGKIAEKRAIAPGILPLLEKKRSKQTHRCRQTGKYRLTNSAKTQEPQPKCTHKV
jgi:hypothetical protein